MVKDVPPSLTNLPNPLLGDILDYVGDALSLFRLAWTCRFWRAHRLLSEDTWRRLLLGQLDGADRETCGRLCELSGMDCRSLAMAVVSSARGRRRPGGGDRPGAVDPRTLGLITFLPQRSDLHNDTRRLQKACVDAVRWGMALSGAPGSEPGRFLWEGRGGRAHLLVSCCYDHFLREVRFRVEGESVCTFQDRDEFLSDIEETIGGDCWFIHLDPDAPPRLAWMNGDARRDEPSFEDAREEITRDDIAAVVEANSGMTLGMFCGGGGTGSIFHYRAARHGSRARRLNPMARYAMHRRHMGEELNLCGMLNELFISARAPPNLSGYPPVNTSTYPTAKDWPGWPFGLPGKHPSFLDEYDSDNNDGSAEASINNPWSLDADGP